MDITKRTIFGGVSRYDMDDFDKFINDSDALTTTIQSGFGYWEAILTVGCKRYAAVVPSTMMGDATTGEIRPISEEEAEDLMGYERGSYKKIREDIEATKQV